MAETEVVLKQAKKQSWPVWQLILTVLIFISAAALRFYDLQDAPLDFHPTRQLHSLLIARGMYAQHAPQFTEVQRGIAESQQRIEGLIEPPIMEKLVALTYQLTGQVDWIGRIYAILFWLLGGIPVFLILLKLKDWFAAWAGLVFFFFLPYGVYASRAFQPDPLLTCMILWSWWAALRWYDQPDLKNGVLAGLLTGLAVLVKSTAVFFVLSPFIGLVLAGMGLGKALKNASFWLLVVLTIVPYAIFHYYGVYASGLLVEQFSLRFFPNLWLTPAFYLQWFGQINGTVGLPFFLLGILACLIPTRKSGRIVIISILVGYFIYGMTFSYHITTHDYYQLPLVAWTSLGIGLALSAILERLNGPVVVARSAFIFIVMVYLVLNAWDVRVTLKRLDYRGEVGVWQKLGETVGHGSKVIGLMQDYGLRLAYWGWMIPSNWMTESDIRYRALAGQTYNFEDVFQESIAGKEYFIVTLFNEYENQNELKTKLETGYPLYKESSDYLIFDLLHPLELQP